MTIASIATRVAQGQSFYKAKGTKIVTTHAKTAIFIDTETNFAIMAKKVLQTEKQTNRNIKKTPVKVFTIINQWEYEVSYDLTH